MDELTEDARVDPGPAITSQTPVSPGQSAAVEQLEQLFKSRPFGNRQTIPNLALFMRAGSIAKILFLDYLYREVLAVPGIILDLGTWLGGNAVTFESLRAIYEPYNVQRRIVAFDTFAGYPIDGRDLPPHFSRIIAEGTYDSPPNYEAYLELILATHESRNVGGHVRKHTVVKGDVSETVPNYIREHPEAQVALAYFDLALEGPTVAAFEAIEERLVPGSIVVLDEFGHDQYPGESVAYRRVMRRRQHTISKFPLLPDRVVIRLTD